ncbi:unnamed protein product, partial [marine sediment metagenome]
PGFHLDVSEQQMTWKEAWEFGYSLSERVRYNYLINRVFGRPGSICGARGCIRACMDHLEKEGKIENKFHNSFQKRKVWLVEKEERKDWNYIVTPRKR